jgi:uncharacterized flavoprotein (TIGR03862 family)
MSAAVDCDVAIVGGGPAGLMAAEVLAQHGRRVDLHEAMPSVGRKFLLAGKGGLNLTHSEAFEPMVARYGAAAEVLRPMLRRFGATELRDWAQGLGIETFIGSSGRVFPREMKAAPLLRRWLQRLRAMGVNFHVRHRFAGFACADGAPRRPPTLKFTTPEGDLAVSANAVLLALGGASWPQLGSDGAWVAWLQQAGVGIAPLQPANCGFDAAGGWTEHLRTRFAGTPLKGVRLHWVQPDGAPASQIGEFVLTESGVEGSLIYAASAGIREAISRQRPATVTLDLLPQRNLESIERALAAPRGSRSLSTHLKARLGLDGVRTALIHELLPREAIADTRQLAAALKALPLRLQSARPIAEAISTAGGVRFSALDEGLMLRDLPGVFCAGEMLDWETPTGGYLLTACFATGVEAAKAALRFDSRGASAAMPDRS